MNEAHLKLCASPDWAAFVESELDFSDPA